MGEFKADTLTHRHPQNRGEFKADICSFSETFVSTWTAVASKKAWASAPMTLRMLKLNLATPSTTGVLGRCKLQWSTIAMAQQDQNVWP